MNAATAFRAAVESEDIEAARALLAEDIVFHSPATFHPFIGKDTVGRLLEIVSQTFEDFRYTDELQAPGGRARADLPGGHRRARDRGARPAPPRTTTGLIADFTVMLRPISGLLPFAQAMGEKVQAAGLATTRA